MTHLDDLAEVMLDQENHDITDVYEALKPLICHRWFQILGEKLELCPLHCCDIQICLDDRIHGLEVYKA